MKSLVNDDAREYRPLVYILSPLSTEDPDSVSRTNKFYRYAMKAGYLPVATVPIYAEVMNQNDPEERDLMLFTDNVLMAKADEVWVLGDRLTDRMMVERDIAKRRRQTIRYFTNDFAEQEAL